jgi:FixJ family two-component response regulator
MIARGPIVYVVDDDVSVRRALKFLLKSHGFRAEAFASGEGFLAFRHPKVPACLVLDIQMPGLNGLALQEAMAARHQAIPIIFLTGHGDIPMSVKGIKAGAVDFLLKPFTGKKLLDAVALALIKSKAKVKEEAALSKIKRRIKTLSPRELEVFRLVAKGMLSKQIARKRGTALQTIKVHRGRVMQKMHARTVTELIRFAQQTGITPSQR